MATELKPDICVIGGGSGGLTVAAVAAAFDVPVVLIERAKMGGDCLNYGCVPSKSLLAAGKQARGLSHGAAFGVSAAEPDIDFAKAMRHVHDVIAAIAPNDSLERFTSLGVKVIQAEARFKDARTVVAGEHEIRARRFVIATGSSPALPPIPGLEEAPYLTNETVFELRQRPAHLIVIGGGPVGVELAQAHCRLGTRVTIVEASSALGKEDPELAALVVQRLREEGVEILEDAKIQRVEHTGPTDVRLLVQCKDGVRRLEGSHLLVATGRRPNLEALRLERAGIAFDTKGIKVSSKLRTTNRRAYAIGDVAGGLQFTHVANYHAGLIIRALLFRMPAKEDRKLIPRVTYTEPELAHIGLTEEDARKRHRHVRVFRQSFAESDRAQTERETGGFVKLVLGRRGRILGVSIVGHGAGEMMHLWSLALSRRMRARHIAGYVAPYPTFGETGRRAAISSFTDATRNTFVRRLIRFLRLFG